MSNKDLIRLQHMLDSTVSILEFIKGRKRKDLDQDKLLAAGIVRQFEVLGEAAGNVSQQTRNRFPEIPWKQLIGMRNRLIHAYFDVDHDIVWQTAMDLPSFLNQLEQTMCALRG
jgi:uncharacterized protein with HEPN domain